MDNRLELPEHRRVFYLIFEFFINFAAAAFLRDCFDIKSLNYFIYYGKIIISVAVNMFIINKR